MPVPAAGDVQDPNEREAFERAWRTRFVQFGTARQDDAGIAGWSTTGLETRFRFFRRLWRRPQGRKLYLDVGCGAGTYSRWLAQQGLDVIGIDYSLVALAKAKPRAGEGISYLASDARRLPLGTASADGALCFGVLQAVGASREIVAELARVVRPGGEVWIDALNASTLAARWDRARRRLKGRPMHLRYEWPERLEDLMRNAGFEKVRRDWLFILPTRLYWFHSLAEAAPVRWLFDVIPGLGSIASHAVVVRGIRSQSAASGERN